MNRIQTIGLGSILGFGGIIIMGFGAALSNLWFMRLGIVLTTIGGWIITWK